MDNRRNQRIAVTVLAVVVATLLPANPASATISIVGVDSDAGEVGVAVASCVPATFVEAESGTSEIVALVPGVGAGISQAQLNSNAPSEISRLLAQGSSGPEIIERLVSDDFDGNFDARQHAVVTLDGNASGFTGKENTDVALDIQDVGVSVQGNILVSEAVALDALAAFHAQDGPLATKLVDALVAAAEQGGDSRCAAQTALFAHVAVAATGDDPQNPSVLLWVTVDEGTGENPILMLAQEFRAGNDQVSVLNATDSLLLKALPLAIVAGIVIVLGLFLLRIVRRLVRSK